MSRRAARPEQQRRWDGSSGQTWGAEGVRRGPSEAAAKVGWCRPQAPLCAASRDALARDLLPAAGGCVVTAEGEPTAKKGAAASELREKQERAGRQPGQVEEWRLPRKAEGA